MTPPDPTSEATPYRLPAVSGKVPNTQPGRYLGYTVRETAGNTGEVILYDSVTAPTGSTPILEEINLNASESARDEFDNPKLVTLGIWAQITGAVEGSVFQ